jgi:hypothetical protein
MNLVLIVDEVACKIAPHRGHGERSVRSSSFRVEGFVVPAVLYVGSTVVPDLRNVPIRGLVGK